MTFREAGLLSFAIAIAIGVIMLVGGCTSSGVGTQDGMITKWGTMREALREGDTSARVKLADLKLNENTYGVGAIEGLMGEITIDGGRVWVTECDSPNAVHTTTDDFRDRSATLLFMADVGEWHKYTVSRDIAPAEVEDYLADLIAKTGVESKMPLAFVIEGAVTDLRLHVIGGECPMRARMLDQEMTKPPFMLEADEVNGRIVGVFEREGTGNLTHMGSDTHMHLIFDHDGQTMTGHIEAAGLAKGAVVYIPSP